MALSAPRSIFGIHSVSPYSRTTGLPYGILKVLSGSSITLEGEVIDLMGGSSKYPWAAEDGQIKSEISLKFKEYHDFMFELFLGKAVTTNAAETSGAIATALTNKSGTSIMNASTGIASVSSLSGSTADMKMGHYVVKYVSATTVDVYYLSDADIARGTNGTMQNDALKITATALTVATGADVNVPNFGIKFTGGSGSIAFTATDTATFEVRPVNTGSTTVSIGAAADSTFPEFGMIIMAQKRSTQLIEIDAVRCKASGMPIGFEQNAWSEGEVKIKALYDSTLDKVFTFTEVRTSGA